MGRMDKQIVGIREEASQVNYSGKDKLSKPCAVLQVIDTE
jgi:hypothetical protein